MHMLRKKYRIQLKIQNVINLTWTTRESLYSVNCWSSKYFRKEKRTTC